MTVKGDHIILNGETIAVSEVENSDWDVITDSVNGLTIAHEGIFFEYTYDLLNRVTEVKKNGETKAEYLYDESGLMVKKTGSKGTIYYTYSMNGKLLYEENEDSHKYRQYMYVFGKHFAREEGSVGSDDVTRYYYHTDHLGSVTAVTDETGKILWQNDYTPFGELADQYNTYDGAQVYAGYFWDEDAELYYAKARWYDAETGRFTTVDPVKDGVNWYVYVRNNPMGYVDAGGLSQNYYFHKGIPPYDAFREFGIIPSEKEYNHPYIAHAIENFGLENTPPPSEPPGPMPTPSTDETKYYYQDPFVAYVFSLLDKDEPKNNAKNYIKTNKTMNPYEFIENMKDGVFVFSTNFMGAAHTGVLVVYTNEDGTRGFYATEMHGNDPDVGGTVGGIYGKYEGYIMREYGGDFEKDGSSNVRSRVDKKGNFYAGGFNDFFERITIEEVTIHKSIDSGMNSSNLKDVIISLKVSTAIWDRHHPSMGACGPNCTTFSHFAIINALGSGKWQHINKGSLGSLGE